MTSRERLVGLLTAEGDAIFQEILREDGLPDDIEPDVHSLTRSFDEIPASVVERLAVMSEAEVRAFFRAAFEPRLRKALAPLRPS